jgi:prolyl-tRNA synthetase
MLIPTVKETPADAVVTSHRLMMRAGMIRKVAAGIYTYLPLGWRVFEKVSKIVREELDRAGAQELHMPAVQPSELWEQSGRWQQYGPELLRFQDRKGADFCFGPTHEEVVTSLVRDEVRSYKQVPINLYQIQTKFRDEIRPRFGLMRGREFIMKDAYSFDIDEDGANKSYDAMYEAYTRIFARMGLEFRPVEADTGAIGGNRSHEFQVIADTGEDAIVVCDACGYAANVELASIKPTPSPGKAESEVETVSTPGKKTIADVAGFLGVEPQHVIKAVCMLVDDEPVLALCRGDHEVNEIKLKRAVSGTLARMLEDKEVQEHIGGPAGYVGPVRAKEGLRIVADHALEGAVEMVSGANQVDAHLTHVAVGRDFTPEFADLRTAVEGDPCGRCGEPLKESRGIEVGHVFFLGTKYSEAMGAKVQTETADEAPLVMGCYGIGITRTAAAAIEQNHDDDGIRWPAPIAPFHVSLLALGKDDAVKEAAEKLYGELQEAGLEVLFDDRDDRPGVKFKDADLIGCPVRVSVGKKGLDKGEIEVKRRDQTRDETQRVPPADAAKHVADIIEGLLAEAQAKADK